MAVGSCRVSVDRSPPDPVLLADTAMRLLPCKSAGGDVMRSKLGCAFGLLPYAIFIVGFFIAAILIISEVQ